MGSTPLLQRKISVPALETNRVATGQELGSGNKIRRGQEKIWE